MRIMRICLLILSIIFLVVFIKIKEMADVASKNSENIQFLIESQRKNVETWKELIEYLELNQRNRIIF